jgi:hypothetical protein
MRRKPILITGTASALAIGLAVHALAAADATVATYTGCLKNGKIESVAVGDAPLAPCGSDQAQLRLSGGDVTAVVAGRGLLGGGDAGAVTLAVDQSTIPRTDVVAGFHDDDVVLPIGDTSQPVARLPVPRGRYAVTATLTVDSLSIAANHVTCKLSAGADFDRTTVDLDGALSGPLRTTRIVLEVVHDFADAGDFVIACAGTYQADARVLKVIATRVSSLTNTQLEMVSQ